MVWIFSWTDPSGWHLLIWLPKQLNNVFLFRALFFQKNSFKLPGLTDPDFSGTPQETSHGSSWTKRLIIVFGRTASCQNLVYVEPTVLFLHLPQQVVQTLRSSLFVSLTCDCAWRVSLSSSLSEKGMVLLPQATLCSSSKHFTDLLRQMASK